MQTDTILILLVISKVFIGILAYMLYRSRSHGRSLENLISLHQQKIESTENVKEKIFFVVGHHMKSSINVLNSFNMLLQQGDVSMEKLSLYDKELRNSLNNHTFLLDNLFNWATVSADGFKFHIERFDVAMRLENIRSRYSNIIERKQLRIINAVASGCMVHTDMGMIEVVLKNVIDNAVKFTEKGGSVGFSSREDGKYLNIIIQDNGTGMSAELLEKLSADQGLSLIKSTSGTDNEEGTGVGLLVSKGFIKKLGGELKFESEPGKGTSVTICIPK